jgi:hypothetical protein
MQSNLPVNLDELEPQASAGPSTIEACLDQDFDFQIVVFKVYFQSSNLHMKKRRSQHLSKRSKIRSLRFLGMASTFRGLLSRQCLHYRRLKRIVVLKATVLKTPSICQESRCTTFGASCDSYIRCAFCDSQLSIRHLYDIILFSIDQTPIRKFDEWAGVLSLANMWVFQEVWVFCFYRKFLCSD